MSPTSPPTYSVLPKTKGKKMTQKDLEKAQLALSKKLLELALCGKQSEEKLIKLECLNRSIDSLNRAAYYIMSLENPEKN